jgi:hypothetical protein
MLSDTRTISILFIIVMTELFIEWVHETISALSDPGVIIDLDEDLLKELELQPHEELFLRFCLTTSGLGLLYVSFLLHESLFFFVLARCQQKLLRWRRFLRTWHNCVRVTCQEPALLHVFSQDAHLTERCR